VFITERNCLLVKVMKEMTIENFTEGEKSSLEFELVYSSIDIIYLI
jgi:hypothetical protein